ncbi:MAG TPA: hypothetical protein PK509_12875 [Catalimonadaceae bacterium]|nr:hypothetical protein [Catalimonadaceae bacterium]
MEERGHLGNRFRDESQNPERELWTDIEAGLNRKRKRRPLIIWFLLAGFLLISGGTALYLHFSPDQIPTVARIESSQPNSETGQIQIPISSDERLTETTGTKHPRTNPAQGPSKENQQNDNQKIESISKSSGKTNKSHFANKHFHKPAEKINQITLEPVRPPSNETQVQNSVAIENPANLNPENRNSDSLVTIQNNEATRPLSNLNLLFPSTSTEKNNPEKVHSKANENKTETNPNVANNFSQDQRTQPESDRSIVFNSDTGSIKGISDTLTKKMLAVADSAQTPNDSIRPLQKEPTIQKWHFGLEWTISGVHRELYINQNPDFSRIEVLNPRDLNPERISLQLGGFMERIVSERLSVILKPSLLLIQDRTDANLNIRKLGVYKSRLDQDGNEWFQPLFDKQRIRIRTMRIMAQLSAGLAFHLSKRKSFVLEAGVNRTVYSNVSISGADPKVPIFSKASTEWNGVLRGGFRIKLTEKFGMEPSATFFLKPMATALKGNKITPVLFGVSLRYSFQ